MGLGQLAETNERGEGRSGGMDEGTNYMHEVFTEERG